MSALASRSAAPVLDAATRLAVEELLCDYAHALDDVRIDDWPGFFTEDGIYQITTRENLEAGYPIGIVYCNGQGMMRDRVEALKSANIFERHFYCHLLGRPSLREERPGLIAARSNFGVLRTMQDGQTEMFATGKFVDLITLEPAPRFRERRVVLDSRRIDILLVYPL
jgi:anthranilate 1,2-dioxygenase small subunit